MGEGQTGGVWRGRAICGEGRIGGLKVEHSIHGYIGNSQGEGGVMCDVMVRLLFQAQYSTVEVTA